MSACPLPHFEHRFLTELPGLCSRPGLTPLRGGRLLYWSRPLATELGLAESLFAGSGADRLFNGIALLPGMAPIAQVYSGHQFGVWAGQLGDGRGQLLGEQRLADGRHLDWHLKGSGLTPYSRQGDGRAVIRSCVREFLASEALFHLGVPTTRALALVVSDEPVYRERVERGAMLLRVAERHIRFGHFEHCYANNLLTELRQLTDFVIHHHWPALLALPEPERLTRWFREVVERTARLMAHWQAVGFNHGVMNTDNMSILGLTFDFGPYGFLDAFEPHHICNHSDYSGRYAFDTQPAMGLWNLNRLAQSLTPLLPAEALQAGLQAYEPALQAHYYQLMRAKLGLTTAQPGDVALLNELLGLMAREGRDYHGTFRSLCELELDAPGSRVRDEFVDRAGIDAWLGRYRQRLRQEASADLPRQAAMRAVNPRYVLRNYLAQLAILAAEQDDPGQLARLHHVLQRPFDEQPEYADLAAPPPAWGRQLEISCSS